MANAADCDAPSLAAGPTLQAQDVVAGLGAAPRDLLATSLALFEDSTLLRRLRQLAAEYKGKWFDKTPASDREQQVAESLQTQIEGWKSSPVTDEVLRVVLWMRLREALGLPALTFGSLRSARTAADDLVAATLASIQPGTVEKAKQWAGLGSSREVPDSLDALAKQTLAELVNQVLTTDDQSSVAARQALVRDMKARVAQLDEASQQSLLKAIGASELNDDAIRTMMLTGGGLASFGGAVSLGGFSAYILAAQASAFIPLVSGPALVSFVAVLSNPITIVLTTFGVGYLVTASANEKIQAAIATRVISLLALSGMSAGENDLRRMAASFTRLPGMAQAGTLDAKVLAKYQENWAPVAPAHKKAAVSRPAIADALDSLSASSTRADRWDRLLRPAGATAQDVAAMSVLTLGELLYNIHALDPSVLKAADFSRIADLSDPIEFAAFAHAIEQMDVSSQLGALSNLKGYVAEQMVAAQLVEQGHVVEFPTTSNEPGWDLAVDGVRFQVKNAADPGLLQRHFDKGYDYPVLANSEMAQWLSDAESRGVLPSWADQVHFVEGYSQASVDEVMEQTLAAGDGMLHPHVPAFGVTLAAVRQLHRYSKGQVTGSQAVQEVLINGSITAGLAVTGNFVGVGIGLLVFGPAGGVVLGSALPILSRTLVGGTRRAVEGLAEGDGHKAWSAHARQNLERLMAVLEAALKHKAETIKRRIGWQQEDPVSQYLDWRLDEDVCFVREAWIRLTAIRDNKTLRVEEAGARLVVWMSTCTLHPATYQAELREWTAVMGRKPGFSDNVAEHVEVVKGFITEMLAAGKKAFDEKSKALAADRSQSKRREP